MEAAHTRLHEEAVEIAAQIINDTEINDISAAIAVNVLFETLTEEPDARRLRLAEATDAIAKIETVAGKATITYVHGGILVTSYERILAHRPKLNSTTGQPATIERGEVYLRGTQYMLKTPTKTVLDEIDWGEDVNTTREKLYDALDDYSPIDTPDLQEATADLLERLEPDTSSFSELTRFQLAQLSEQDPAVARLKINTEWSKEFVETQALRIACYLYGVIADTHDDRLLMMQGIVDDFEDHEDLASSLQALSRDSKITIDAVLNAVRKLGLNLEELRQRVDLLKRRCEERSGYYDMPATFRNHERSKKLDTLFQLLSERMAELEELDEVED